FLSIITVTGDTNDLLTNFGALAITALPSCIDPDLAASLVVDGDGSLLLEVMSLSASLAMGADFNGDGIVDNGDLDIFSMFFGTTEGATVLTGDANGDGAVNGADFVLIKEQFGGAPVPVFAAVVPEPSAAVLLLAAAAGLSGRRRRLPPLR
ncbi:MAG: dockerin type I domain-containing protein, partial [Planctomycetota bacterium]